LNGAVFFKHSTKWAKEMGLVLNFEARALLDRYMLMETNKGNASLGKEFAAANYFPVSNLNVYIYKMLPNDTDLTVFEKERFKA
jgi:hypothetical protein